MTNFTNIREIDTGRIKDVDKLEFIGGTVTCLTRDRGYRRLPMPALLLRLTGVYEGKREPVIFKFRPESNKESAVNLDVEIEIPATQLMNFFPIPTVEMLERTLKYQESDTASVDLTEEGRNLDNFGVF